MPEGMACPSCDVDRMRPVFREGVPRCPACGQDLRGAVTLQDVRRYVHGECDGR